MMKFFRIITGHPKRTKLFLKAIFVTLQIGFSAFMVLMIVRFALLIAGKNKDPLPGVAVKTIDPIRIEPGESHPPYLTNPPTSGWYAEYNTRSGIHREPLSDEKIVEALHKGNVVITYNCNYNAGLEDQITPIQPSNDSPSESGGLKMAPAGDVSKSLQTEQFLKKIELQNLRCASTFTFLQDIVNQKGPDRIVMTPRASQDTRIALAFWGRLETMNLLDRARIEKFIDAFAKKDN